MLRCLAAVLPMALANASLLGGRCLAAVLPMALANDSMIGGQFHRPMLRRLAVTLAIIIRSVRSTKSDHTHS